MHGLSAMDVGRRDRCAELLVGEIGSVLAGVCMVFAMDTGRDRDHRGIGACVGWCVPGHGVGSVRCDL